ncbi:hypothetical protein CASFOL_038880 [Castilleja foliolosa]|uniref:U1-type domain-containing protein n=1 Tax=Castilleja foliolosa TaxID=1961234 RepID=A0ABD3BKS5_9LAMI
MGLMGQLKFAFFCIDFLAWPVIGLAYPLFVSIRAIETGSNYHMKKVPFWSVIRLMAIFWLAIPRFHGACYAYNSFVRPFLVVKLQELISRLDEKCHSNKETFIDVANKHIEENGFEGLEMLNATKVKDNEISEASEENVATEVTKQVQPVTTSNLVTKGILGTSPEQTYAAAVTKGNLGTSPTQTTPVTRKPATTPVMPHPEKLVKREWTCPLCKVTTSCENNLNMHLRGKRHKDVVEALKSTKINASKARPGKSAGPDKGGVSRHWCFACDVELVGGASLASHLKGKRHASNVVKNGIDYGAN